jgi:hypothetical protein
MWLVVLQGLEPTPSRANMATALEEPTMRKTIGLCFLALTMTAGTARAQGLFLEKGQPGIGAAVGGVKTSTAWAASLVPTYTYRGVFDIGLDLTRYQFTGGDANHLWALGVMPFATAYLVRSEESTLPVSLSATLGIQRRLFLGNGSVPNPDGWGVLAGLSVFRRLNFSNSFAGIPEVFVAYDLQSITWHSSTTDGNAAVHPGQVTNYENKPRILLRANMAFGGEKSVYTLVPYVGYQGGFAFGANLGAIF